MGELALCRWKIEDLTKRIAGWRADARRAHADPEFTLQTIYRMIDEGVVEPNEDGYVLDVPHVVAGWFLQWAADDEDHLEWERGKLRWLMKRHAMTWRADRHQQRFVLRDVRPRRDGHGRVRSRRIRTPHCTRAPARPRPADEDEIDPSGAAA